MPPKNSKSWWETGAGDRDIDKYFSWKFYCEAEDRSLDRLHEMFRREAATRAVMKIKDKIRDAGIFVPPSSKEHFLAALSSGGGPKPRPTLGRKPMSSLGNLSEGLARAAHLREVEEKAKRPRKRRRS